MKLATRKAEPAAPVTTPRRQRRAAEIVAAARAVFVDKGFERASVAEIAARVGVVEGLVYSYFPSKRELLNEVLRGLYEPLIRDIDAGFVSGAVIRVDGGVPTARHTWTLPPATNRFPYDGFPQYEPPQTFADLVPPKR